MSRLLLLLLIIVSVPAYAESPHTAFPEGKGKQKVINNCTVCHSHRLITQSAFSKRRWNELIDWMQEKQGLWELSSNDRKEITTYLSTYYGKKKTDEGMYSFEFSRPMFLD